jgi:chorismate mutase
MDEIIRLRKQINKIDKTIIKLIANRYGWVEKIKTIKTVNKIKIRDNKRELWLYDYYSKLCQKYNLEEKHIGKIFSIIISQSKKIQK